MIYILKIIGYYAQRNKSVRKSQEPYDCTDMWDTKLKLIDTDNIMLVTRGKGVGEWWEHKRVKYLLMEDDITLGVDTMQYTDHV